MAESSTVGRLLGEVTTVGTDRRRGGDTRPRCFAAPGELREWFTEHAARRGLEAEPIATPAEYSFPTSATDLAAVPQCPTKQCPTEELIHEPAR